MSTNKLTVSEFRYWLSGVEEMQPDDWCPSKQQWDKIRDKIDQLEVTQPVMVQPQIDQPIYRTPAAPVAPVIDPNRPVQYVGGGLSPAAAPPPNAALFGTDTPGITSKTPNIDTSNGQYLPAFL